MKEETEGLKWEGQKLPNPLFQGIQPFAFTHSSFRRTGFSLIETLVAMVILAVGILSLVSLFPGGFLVLQRTSEMSVAQGLANEQLSALRHMEGPPLAVLPALPKSDGTIQLLNGIQPDDLSPTNPQELSALQSLYNFSLPTGFLPYFFSDVNRIRYIQGESFTIPVATTGVGGSVHILQYGPVYNVFHTDNNGNPADSILVYGPPLTRHVENSQPSFNNPNPIPVLNSINEYAIDYANNNIAFYPRPVPGPNENRPNYRLFLLKFRTYQKDANGYPIPNSYQTQTVTITVTDVPTTSSLVPVWQPIFPNTPLSSQPNIDPYSDEVSRQFRLVSLTPGPNPPFTTDPYEYAWLSPQEPNNANRGVLLFNPIGHVSALQPTASGTLQQPQNLVAYVDYLTYDNHIIRDDSVIPSQAPYTIRLSLGHILSQGDVLPDQTTYNGLFHNDPADTSADDADLIVQDMDNGQQICRIVAGQSTPGSLVSATLDAKNGILTFSQPGIENNRLQNVPIRVFYRADRRWGMQVQMATASYQLVSSPSQITSTTCWVGDGTNGSSPRHIYFALSESGKTVSLGEVHYTRANTNPNDLSTYGVAHNVTLQITELSRVDNINGTPYVYADITDQIPNATALSSKPTGLAVNYVSGLSVRSRVVWSDPGNSKYILWRHVDRDTVLSRHNTQ